VHDAIFIVEIDEVERGKCPGYRDAFEVSEPKAVFGTGWKAFDQDLQDLQRLQHSIHNYDSRAQKIVPRLVVNAEFLAIHTPSSAENPSSQLPKYVKSSQSQTDSVENAC
jgi:hypothetical protein